MMKTVNLTIDGKQVTVPEGTTVLNAAKQTGSMIPVFCYHGELEPIGACRMCLVEIEKMPKLAISCAQVVAEGMVVQTRSEKVLKAQKGMLEFLLINHPLDCPVCDKGGECELQDNTFAYGPGASRFVEFKRRYEKKNLNELIRLDMNRCIMCRRCVRTCSDLHGQGVLGVIERGYRSEITMFSGAENQCTYCGDCIEACPVGALTSIPFRFKARIWELRRTDTVCNYCADGCRMTLETKGQQIIRVRDRLTPGEYLSTEHLCVKGHFGFDVVQSPERITSPMVKKNGELVAVDWDEALETAANGLKKFTGSQSGVLSSPRLTNEENYLVKKLAKDILKTDNIDYLQTPNGSFTNESFQRLSAHPAKLEDIEVAQAIIVIGTNIEESNPLARLKIIRSCYRDIGKVVTIYPHDAGLRGYVNHDVKPRYGTESMAIGMGLPIAMGEFGFITPNPKEALAKSLDEIANLTGVSVETYMDAVRTIANAERRVILFGREVLSHPHREDYLKAIENLVYYLNHLSHGVTKVLWLPEYNNSRGVLDLNVTPTNSGLNFSGMVEAAEQGRLKSMVILGENPIVRGTDKPRIEHALNQLEFLVVQEMFLTETAKLADVVFPACSYAEKDGTFTAGEGLVQKLNPAFPPKGETKPDWYILTKLANAMGIDWEYISTKEILTEMNQALPAFKNINYDELGRDGLYLEYSAPESIAAIQNNLAGNIAADPLKENQFYLVSENNLVHSGSMTQHAAILMKLSPKPLAYISRADAKRMNLQDGQLVTIATDKSSLELEVKIKKYQAEKTICIASNFPGFAINTLIIEKDKQPIVTVKGVSLV